MKVVKSPLAIMVTLVPGLVHWEASSHEHSKHLITAHFCQYMEVWYDHTARVSHSARLKCRNQPRREIKTLGMPRELGMYYM